MKMRTSSTDAAAGLHTGCWGAQSSRLQGDGLSCTTTVRALTREPMGSTVGCVTSGGSNPCLTHYTRVRMFTDNPTIPAQLEVLLDVAHAMRQRKATPDSLRQMIQPKGLPDLTSSSRQLALHLSAATE